MTKGAKRRVDPLTKKLRKTELVSFLTSEGGIKEGLARSIYEQGLDRWSKLVNGDETFFLSFRGVGLKTAAVLLELSREKKKEFETKEERSRRLSEVRDLLSGIPRLRATAVNDAIRAGFDSVASLSTADPEELRKVKGVGPKLAMVIIEHAKEALSAEPVGPEVQVAIEPVVPPVIEEATGLIAEEAPTEGTKQEVPGEQKGFFERFLEGLKRFFSPAKEGSSEEPPKESVAPEGPPAPVEEVPKEGEALVKVDGGENEGPEPGQVTIETVPEDAPTEPASQPVVGTVQEPPNVEPQPEPPKAEGPPAVEKATEKPPSFFQKLKSKVFGGPKEAAPEPPKSDVKPAEGSHEQPDGSQSKAADEPVQGSAPTGPKRFEDIPGVDEALAQRLRDSGYLDIEELKEAIPEDLMMIEGISKEVAEAICSNLKPSV